MLRSQLILADISLMYGIEFFWYQLVKYDADHCSVFGIKYPQTRWIQHRNTRLTFNGATTRAYYHPQKSIRGVRRLSYSQKRGKLFSFLSAARNLANHHTEVRIRQEPPHSTLSAMRETEGELQPRNLCYNRGSCSLHQLARPV